MSRSLLLCAAALITALPALAAPLDDEPIQPIPVSRVSDPGMVELGKKLFFDPRLSRSGLLSCNSCHNLAAGGSDNLTSSIGHRWQKGPINAPTVLNSSLHLAQFWDGRAPDLKTQAGGPIANPAEMASSHAQVVTVLSSIPAYVTEFKTVFGTDAIEIEQVTRSIAAFEETLVTPDSRFDRWLKGDAKALTETERAGYQLFKDSGCVACHNGPAVGGNSFQKMGVVEPYSTRNPSVGRMAVTGDPDDRMVFKVPSLRNVELTAPYFHDGAAATLTQAVETMGRVQLGLTFTPEEKARIVAFLKTLTGRPLALRLPALPPSSDTTPRPRPFEE